MSAFAFAIFLILTVNPFTLADHNVHFYNASRDYLHVTSENYPESYRPGVTYTWEWSAKDGHWAVYFLDFDLVCEPRGDILKIGDSNGKTLYYYRCQEKPPELFFQAGFRMQLQAVPRVASQSDARGFQCHVFYGKNKGDVESKLNAMKAMVRNEDKDEEDNVKVFSGTVIALIIVLIIVFIIVAVLAIFVKRRQHQQPTTTNTSVHVNIEGIRREASVSYSRNGGGRARLESEDSFSPDLTSPKPRRSVKRSESNASWAMRAEMATSARTGSSSSEGQNASTTHVHNVYTPLPTDAKTQDLGDGDTGDSGCGGLGEKGVGTSDDVCTSARLSSISEESSASKLRTSFPVPKPVSAEDPSVAIANAGYMVMTSCGVNYIN